MTRAEASKLVAELRGCVGSEPGDNPVGLKRAKEIRLAFREDSRATAYLLEKLDVVLTYIDYWCRPRRWRHFGGDPTRLKSILLGCVANFESAVDLAYREPEKN